MWLQVTLLMPAANNFHSNSPIFPSLDCWKHLLDQRYHIYCSSELSTYLVLPSFTLLNLHKSYKQKWEDQWCLEEDREQQASLWSPHCMLNNSLLHTRVKCYPQLQYQLCSTQLSSNLQVIKLVSSHIQNNCCRNRVGWQKLPKVFEFEQELGNFGYFLPSILSLS